MNDRGDPRLGVGFQSVRPLAPMHAEVAAVLERVRDSGRTFGVRLRTRFGFGGVVASLTSLSTLASVLAIGLAGHAGGVSHRLAVAGGAMPSLSLGASSRSNRHDRTSTTIKRACAGPLSVAQFRADFAVLQRPQTVADRSWQQPTIASAYSEEKLFRGVPGSTRLATTLANGSRLFVTIERFVWTDRGTLRHPYDCYGHDLLVSLVAGGRAVGHFEWGSAASLAGEDANVPLRSTVGSATWVTLVSNPVRSVRWVFPRQNQNRTHLFPRALTIDVRVSGNVAAARVPRNQGFFPYSVEWLGARGRVIESRVYPPLDGVTGPNSVLPREAKITSGPARDLLSAAGVGTVPFGASPAAVQAMFEHLYGAPDIADHTVNSCGADHFMEWGALGLFFATAGSSATRILTFSTSHLGSSTRMSRYSQRPRLFESGSRGQASSGAMAGNSIAHRGTMAKARGRCPPRQAN
jgi:hypothetical protein